MQSTNKPRPPVPSSTERVFDHGGGSGPSRLCAGNAKNPSVKKSHQKITRLKIATYNVRTLLRDANVDELEDELQENKLVWDVIGLGETRRKAECFTTLQSGNVLYHSQAKNGQAGVGFLINKKWQDRIERVKSIGHRVAELVLCINKRYKLKIVQVYAPTTSHGDEEVENFYNDLDKILEKPCYYTILMGDFNAKVGKRANSSETATGIFGLGTRNERGDTLVEWATSEKFKIMNTMFKKKPKRRWTWKSPDGTTKNEIDYVLTTKPDTITDVTVINRINVGSDHRMVMSSVKLDTKAERKKLIKKQTPKVDPTLIRSRKEEFQVELKNKFDILAETEDLDTKSKMLTETIQQCATSVAKEASKQTKSRLSTETRALMKKRREMAETGNTRKRIEYAEICKTIKKKAREDIRKHNLDTIRTTIEESKSLKKVRKTQTLGQARLITLLDKDGREIEDQDKIMTRIEEFYSELYDSDETTTVNTNPKDVPTITAWEVEAALREMKNGKAAGEDEVNIETLKAGEDIITKALAKLYTQCLVQGRIPNSWKNANMVLIFKKGNKKDIKNYRPICLLSNIYKLLMKIITKRLETRLDENQPREQAGFRSKYSTTDHIHVINQLKEKCREYNIPLCVAFVDYEKAFDSVQTSAILSSLQNQGIEDAYIKLLKDIYTNSSVTVTLQKEKSQKINVKRGVRQGDTISPKLFTATLEDIFRKINWDTKGLKIDGEYLSHLRFADDIVIFAETPQELQDMLQELAEKSLKVGLKMNISKTKVMTGKDIPIHVNNTLIEDVDSYIYLGQRYSLNDKTQDKEIKRRVTAGWAAYAKHCDIFKSNMPNCLKRKVFNSCVLPAMTYGAETWSLTKYAIKKLAAAQTNMERRMLNITYRDRKTNVWVRTQTKVTDVITTARRLKWSWAGHVSRLNDNRWTSRITHWRPYEGKRTRGRPAKRWRDDLDIFWRETTWQRKAQDRQIWKTHAEAFAQLRDTTAAK